MAAKTVIDSHKNREVGFVPINNYAQPITADKAVIFSLQSRNSVPYQKHLKRANPGQRILLLPGREGRLCAGRVNICHGDETRKAGGMIPD